MYGRPHERVVAGASKLEDHLPPQVFERTVLGAPADIPPMRVRGAGPAARERRIEEAPGYSAHLRGVQVYVHAPSRRLADVDPDVLAVCEVVSDVLERDSEPLPARALRVLALRRHGDNGVTSLYVAGGGLRATHAMRSARSSCRITSDSFAEGFLIWPGCRGSAFLFV